MKTLADRINQKMSEQRLTQQSLAERAGLSQAAIYKLTSGKTKETKKLIQLAAALNVDMQWLATGTMRANPATAANAELLGGFEEWDSNTPLLDDEVELPFLREVEVSAGTGKFHVEENPASKLRFAKATLKRVGVSSENAACVRVSGDSMEPVMPDGCTVGIDTSSKRIKDGDIYAIDYDGQLLVKRLYRILGGGGGVRIRSYNESEYQDVECMGEEMSKLNVLGRVFWWSVLR
ncbi:MAG: helix-turn-helix transcriptional regulator [Methylovulum sp.]|nr:helix-turn-helix transcriptional regulator [Methylovulum sp.]